MDIHEDARLIDFLQRGKDYYEELDIPSRISEPTEEAPYTALIVRLSEIGADDAVIDLEFCFVPGLQDAAREGLYLMQTFTVVLSSLDPTRFEQLNALINENNLTLPLGAFGIFEQERTLFFKYNSLWHKDSLDQPSSFVHFDRQNGLILHQLHQYIDSFRHI